MKIETVINLFKGLRKSNFFSAIRENIKPIEYEIESNEVIEQRKNFYNQFISENNLVFDVGANIGNRIVPFLKLKAKVVAFEPQKKCVKILKRRFGKEIEIVKNGLSNQIEIRTFFVSNANTLSSFSERWINSVKNERFSGLNWKATNQIQMITLDLAIRKYGKPDFIKIDVEGFELEVLQGLNTSIKYISFEYTTPEQNEDAIKCIDRILQLNPETLFNYSEGESMSLKFENWIDGIKMKNHVLTNEFINSGFGDIYAQS